MPWQMRLFRSRNFEPVKNGQSPDQDQFCTRTNVLTNSSATFLYSGVSDLKYLRI